MTLLILIVFAILAGAVVKAEGHDEYALAAFMLFPLLGAILAAMGAI